jgi:hypothetical protein
MIEEVNELAQFKELWHVVLLGLGLYLKHGLNLTNKTIPLILWGGAIAGQIIFTTHAGEDVTMWTYLTGAAWGAGMVGLHSSGKNTLELVKQLIASLFKK